MSLDKSMNEPNPEEPEKKQIESLGFKQNYVDYVDTTKCGKDNNAERKWPTGNSVGSGLIFMLVRRGGWEEQ